MMSSFRTTTGPPAGYTVACIRESGAARMALLLGMGKQLAARGSALCLQHRGKAALLCTVCVLCAIVLGLLAGFVPQREGAEIRRRVSPAVAKLHPADMPPMANQSFAPDPGFSVRRAVSHVLAAPAPLEMAQGNKQRALVVFAEQGVSLATTDGPKTVEGLDLAYGFVPVLALDGSPDAPLLSGTLPAEYGESLDDSGRPLRWKEQYHASVRQADRECQPSLARAVLPLEKTVFTDLSGFRAHAAGAPNLLPFNAESTFTRARRYKALVEKSAQRFGLSLDLVYAIIHNESNFAPVLVSNRSAMGLMQLLPSTAGGEVHTFLYGHPAKVTLTDLSNPETNIRYGTAYLHLLLNRHLAQVENKTSREYCAVASYNMGPNGFLRIFSADRADAINIINSMTPEEVYTRLTQHLPIMETRYFVAKVARSREEFASFE